MKKKATEVEAIRDLIRNLGLLSKLLIEFIPALEGLMKTEGDLRAALDKLAVSVTALTAAVIKLPQPSDLAPDIALTDSLTAQVDAATASLTPSGPPPVPVP